VPSLPALQRRNFDQGGYDRSALFESTQMMAAEVHEKSRRTCSADNSISILQINNAAFYFSDG
jgi:hypothetical protein